ncbi:MAG: ribose-phosphate diphosphokinase [Nitrososphaerota archaeon]
MEVTVIGGPASAEQARRLAVELGAEYVPVEHKLFPDGESYLRFVADLKGRCVVVFQGTHPPQDRNLLQLLMISKTARERGASRVLAVVPYLAYARQDREFLQGEVVSIRVVLHAMRCAGVDALLTVNPHSPWALEAGGLESIQVDVTKLLARKAAESHGPFDVVGSPGKKGRSMAEAAAEEIGAVPFHLVSSRDPMTGKVEVRVDGLDVAGKRVLLIDDIISTGGTMADAVRGLLRSGAREVIVSCVHGLFVGDAVERLLGAGASALISTDTVPSHHSRVSVVSELAKAVGAWASAKR